MCAQETQTVIVVFAWYARHDVLSSNELSLANENVLAGKDNKIHFVGRSPSEKKVSTTSNWNMELGVE